MQSQLEGVEIQARGTGDDDLAVEDTIGRQRLEKGLVQLGKVSVERFEVAGLDVDLRLAAEDYCPEPIPLRLEENVAFRRKDIRQLGEHRLDRRGKWEG